MVSYRVSVAVATHKQPQIIHPIVLPKEKTKSPAIAVRRQSARTDWFVYQMHTARNYVVSEGLVAATNKDRH